MTLKNKFGIPEAHLTVCLFCVAKSAHYPCEVNSMRAMNLDLRKALYQVTEVGLEVVSDFESCDESWNGSMYYWSPVIYYLFILTRN